MRDDIDFVSLDSHVVTYLSDNLGWQTDNPAVRFSFDLALESLRDHEIDRCVWTLRKAIEASIDGKGISHAVNQLLVRTNLYPEAIEVLSHAVGRDFNDPAIGFNLAHCLYQTGNYDEAEKNLAIHLGGNDVKSYSIRSLISIRCLLLLASIRNTQGRFLEAKALAQEAISFELRIGDNKQGVSYSNLSFYCEKLNLYDDAINAAKSGLLSDPDFADWNNRIKDLENRIIHSDDEDETEIENDSGEFRNYEEWFKAGIFWHRNIPKDFFYGTREFLEELFLNGATWSDQLTHTFEFRIDENGLEESLARVESLSNHIHLQPTWPIYLETPDISIAMTLNRNYLLAWVGVGLEGLMVGVDIKTWDVFYAEDLDAKFATGAVLNWFLDCSLSISLHEQYYYAPNRWHEIERPWEPDYMTTWSTTNVFHEDIEIIRRNTDHYPPRAHRVRGHIRTLSERQPTDEARENAPAYIRRNMGPTDTFVRSYTKSGDSGTEKLLLHLNTKSSLADFLGTLPRLVDQA